MSKQLHVVLIGKSPLSLFIAKALDRHLGPLVQYKLTWLTDDDELVTDLLSFDPVGKISGVNLKQQFNDLQLKVSSIKSVNLRRQEIITSRSTVTYDFLILDQLPYYSKKELSLIYQQFATLIGALAAAKKGERPISAAVSISGNSAHSAQLAVALRSFQLRHYPSLLRSISLHINAQPAVIQSYLSEHAITKTSAKSAGMVIGSPSAAVSSKLIKGARVAGDGHIVTDPFMRIKGYDNVLCFDSPEWLRSNVLRVYKSFSQHVAEFITHFFENRSLKKLHFPKTSVLLRSDRGHLALIGDMKSKNFRAKLIAKLEESLRR
jgi:hypothetical protein